MACFAPDVLTFDLAPPLQYAGREVIRKVLEDWFPTWDGPIGLEIRDLRVTADGHVAYCTSQQRMSGTKADGEKPNLWFARPCACKRSTAPGASRMSIPRHRSTWMEATRRRVISSHSYRTNTPNKSVERDVCSAGCACPTNAPQLRR